MTDELELDDIALSLDEEGDGQLYEHLRMEVDRGQEPVRIDKYMSEHVQHSSRNRIQKAADAGFIQVNGTPVKSNYKVRPGDIITLMLDRPHYDTTIEPEDIPLDVVYEDDQLMVINKPAGLVVHPGVGNFHGTLVNAIAWHLRNLPAYDPNDPSVGLVHRIDKDTSGLLVVAKTPEAKTELGAQFFNHDTHRSYVALVWGNLTEDTGRIEGNIGRDPKDRQRMTVFPPGSDIGKHAVTHYRVLERYGYTTLVECRLETGRTHQIRAHMKHIGHPLFADERYGGMEILRGERTASYKAYIQNCLKLCSRQALHAKTLGFVHPVTHEQMDFTSELADDMAALIEQWAERIPEMELVKVDESALLSNGSMAERIRYAIVELRTERLLRRKFDYAWLKVAMDSTDDLPSFESAQRYLDYLCDELRLDGLPCESSISKMMDTARGPLFNWTFSDTNDEIETTRRNNIVKRFFNLMRGRK